MKNLWVSFLFLFAALAANAQIKLATNKSGSVVSALPLPKMTQQLTWLGGGGPWLKTPPPGKASLTNLGVGWARGSFGYDSTNTDTFAWRCVQHDGPTSWDWTRADAQIAYLQQLPWKIVVVIDPGPPWALTLSTNDYVAAKGAFVIALAARYAGKIWGLEVENEPLPWDGSPGGSWANYNRHLAILRASQPARQYTKLVGWTCQAPFPSWLVYLVQNGLTNLCDAVSWHLYNHASSPPDVTLLMNTNDAGDPDYRGRLDQWMQWLHTQLGEMPILVDEVGLEPFVPMRMAKVLIMLRAYNANVGLHQWSYGPAPGEFYAFDSNANPYLHAVITAWTAYWLGNDSLVSQTVDGNTFIFAFANRTFVWCLEGTLRTCTASGWSNITDIYGNKTTPIVLTDAVTVFHGTGTLTLTNSPPWRVLQMQ